jgi:hypothetical protein
MKNLQLIMNFESIDELKSFITDQEMINTIKIKKYSKNQMIKEEVRQLYYIN